MPAKCAVTKQSVPFICASWLWCSKTLICNSVNITQVLYFFCGYILFTKRKVCKKWLNMRWPSWHLCVLTSRLCHCQDLTNLISLTLKHIKQKKYGTNTSKCGQFSRNSADFCFSILLELQRTVGHLLQICVVHLRHLRQAKISQLS